MMTTLTVVASTSTTADSLRGAAPVELVVSVVAVVTVAGAEPGADAGVDVPVLSAAGASKLVS